MTLVLHGDDTVSVEIPDATAASLAEAEAEARDWADDAELIGEPRLRRLRKHVDSDEAIGCCVLGPIPTGVRDSWWCVNATGEEKLFATWDTTDC